MWWYGPGWGGWVAMTVTMVAFWALLVIGAVIAWRAIGRVGRTGADRRTPEQLLDERFARGEIDAEEYRSRRDQLRAGR